MRHGGRTASQLEIGLVIGSHRRIGMRHIGNTRLQLEHLLFQPIDFTLHLVLLVTELSSLRLAGFAFGRVFGLADRLGNLIRAAIEVLDFALFRPTFRVQLHKPIHVGRHASMQTVLFDQFRVFYNELAIQHVEFRVIAKLRTCPCAEMTASSAAPACCRRSVMPGTKTQSYRFSTLNLDLAQLFPEMGAGFDAAMKIAEVEFLVRAVRVVVILAPTQQQRIDSQFFVKRRDDWNGATFADEYRWFAKSHFHGFRGSGDERAIQRYQHAGRRVHVDQFGLDSRRTQCSHFSRKAAWILAGS